MAWNTNGEYARPRGRGGNFRDLGGKHDVTPRVAEIVSLSPAVFMESVALALTQSCGVLLSPTSDGGAVSIIIYDGDERYRTYASNREEFADAISAVRDHAEAKMVGGTPRPSKVTGKAS
jgi:hypothetical protein